MPMDLWKLKLICGFVIFVMTFIPSIIPFKLFTIEWGKVCSFCLRKKAKGKQDVEAKRSKEGEEEEGEKGEEEEEGELGQSDLREAVLGHMMCFGGGVFFGTYLTHMSVEAHEILNDTYLGEVSYPLPSLIIGIGFFLVLTTDQIVTTGRGWALKRKKQRKLEKEALEASSSHTNAIFTTSEKSLVAGRGDAGDDDEDKESINGDLKHDRISHSHHHSHHGHSHHGHSHGHHGHGHHGHSTQDAEDRAEMEEMHNHQHATHSIILVLALSLHHIFEGMSIGLQKNYDNVWLLTLSVLIHEIVISFSLGLQFFKSDKELTKKVFIILLISAWILPIGVFIGLGISVAPNQDHTKSDVVNGVLQAIATGTFLYVSFFEILFEELGHDKSSISRVFATIVGFSLMALLGLIPESMEDAEVVEEVGNITSTLAY